MPKRYTIKNPSKPRDKAKRFVVHNLIGQRFGMLVVLCKSDIMQRAHAQWVCECDCGNFITVPSRYLRRGSKESCGCWSKQREDITGQTYNNLTAIKFMGSDRNHNTMWLCKCGCGNETVVPTGHLKAGSIKSCGCYLHKKGSEAAHWNPELTDEERMKSRKTQDYRDWRDSVLGRDKYTCQVCGKVGGKLIGHHLHSYTGYKEMRFDENNGITLCEKCHISFHKQYGYRNNNASQYEEYIGAIFA